MDRRTVPAVVAAMVAAAVVVAVAGVLVLRVSSGDTGDGGGSSASTVDPRTDEFPEADRDVAAATLEYLRGDGAALLVMHDAAVQVGEGVDPEGCASLVAALNRDAPPDQTLSLSAGAADEVLAAALVAERGVLGVALTACVAGDAAEPLGDRVAAVTDAAAAVDARLSQLEEAAG